MFSFRRQRWIVWNPQSQIALTVFISTYKKPLRKLRALRVCTWQGTIIYERDFLFCLVLFCCYGWRGPRHTARTVCTRHGWTCTYTKCVLSQVGLESWFSSIHWMEFVVFLLCTNPVAWYGFRTTVAVKNHHFAVLSRISRSSNAEKG